MKKITLILCLIGAAFSLQAQKSKVRAAYNYYKEPYKQYDKAKEAIDEAVQHEQTSQSDEAWYYRGLIYSALYKNEQYGSLCDNCLSVAWESYKKSLALKPDGDYALEIKTVRIPIYLAYQFNQDGIEQYTAGKYNQALARFEAVHEMVPDDTSSIRNSAYAAERAGDTAKTRRYYEQLLAMGVHEPDMFLSLSTLYKNEGNQDRALQILQQGRKHYPDTLSLLYNEINILLALNRSAEATAGIRTALEKDPSNESLYLALGSTYERLAAPRDASGKLLPPPPEKDSLKEQALLVYLKGLAVNPDNYGLNFNTGAFYFNRAADRINAANKIKAVEESERVRNQAKADFSAAQPYLEKALSSNPRLTADDKESYTSTLNSLKELYARTGQTEKYNEVKALIEKQ
jgi:Flp pilus assembly protein TadD